MSRSKAIELITTKLNTLDDEDILAVADIVQDMETPATAPLILTGEERAAIDRSKEDFNKGRTLDGDQYRVEVAAFWAGLKSKQG